MPYVIGFLAALVLTLVGAYCWIKRVHVFSGPDGKRYRQRATQGPYAAQVDTHDGRGIRRPRADTFH